MSHSHKTFEMLAFPPEQWRRGCLSVQAVWLQGSLVVMKGLDYRFAPPPTISAGRRSGLVSSAPRPRLGSPASCPGAARLSLSLQHRIDFVNLLSSRGAPLCPGDPPLVKRKVPHHDHMPHDVHPRYGNQNFVPRRSFNIVGLLQNTRCT